MKVFLITAAASLVAVRGASVQPDRADMGKGFKELGEASSFLGVPQSELLAKTPAIKATGSAHWSTVVPASMWKPCSHTYCKIETRGTHTGVLDVFGNDGGPWGVTDTHTALRTYHNGRETMGRAHRCSIEEKHVDAACKCECAHESELDRLGDMFSGLTTAAASECAHPDVWANGATCSGGEIPHGDAGVLTEANAYHYNTKNVAKDPKSPQFCQYLCEDAGASCVSFDTTTGDCRCFGGAPASSGAASPSLKAGACHATPAMAHVVDNVAALHWYQMSSTYGSSWGRKRSAELLALPTQYASEAAQRNAREIDINTASTAELDTLFGVGNSYAARIIAHRDTDGFYENVGDLAQVSGISTNSVAKMFSKAGAAYSRPTVHECWVHVSKCPKRASEPVNRWRRETWHKAAQTSETECLARARAMWNWCGNSDGDVIKARYLASGGTTFVEKIERCDQGAALNAQGQCTRSGCWRTASACPKWPTTSFIGKWQQHPQQGLDEAQCHKQAHDIRLSCQMAEGTSSATRWYDASGLEVSSLTATCARGYEPRADSGTCQKVGCWQEITACPFRPTSFMIGKQQPNTWLLPMTKEKCASTAKNTASWCKMDGAEDRAVSTWYGVDGEENNRVGTITTFDASML
jgi:competence protein ComEA